MRSRNKKFILRAGIKDRNMDLVYRCPILTIQQGKCIGFMGFIIDNTKYIYTHILYVYIYLYVHIYIYVNRIGDH